MKMLNILKIAGVAATVAFIAPTTASAVPLACGIGGATLTTVGTTTQTTAATATQCAGIFDQQVTGNNNPAAILAQINSVFAPSSGETWINAGRADSSTGSSHTVVADIGDKTGDWTANFGTFSVSQLIVALKGGNEYGFWLFEGFTPTPSSLFAGTFDMAAAGIRTPNGKNAPELSHLDVAGIYIKVECQDPNGCGGGTGFEVPVPASLPLLLTALGAGGFILRRRQNKAA